MCDLNNFVTCIVRMGSILEYNISAVEMVQRWATHWVKSDYHWESSVIVMLCDLQWSILHSIEKFQHKNILYCHLQ